MKFGSYQRANLPPDGSWDAEWDSAVRQVEGNFSEAPIFSFSVAQESRPPMYQIFPSLFFVGRVYRRADLLTAVQENCHPIVKLLHRLLQTR